MPALIQPSRLRVIAVGICWLCFSGCFGRWVMSPKELREYYRDKPKPVFFTIEKDSIRLFCATAGSDTLPPLLLVHGAPGAWYSSRTMLEDSLLQQKFHIIAVDRPGYNNSRFKNSRKAVTSISTQAMAIIEALRLNKSRYPGIVLGSSYGAPIALEIAVKYSEKFRHLFLLSAAIEPDKEKFWWFHKYIKRGPAYWVLPRFLKRATDEKFSHVNELRKLEVLWKELNIPVTMIQGEADRIVDPSNVEYARKHLEGKQNEYIMIPGEGHILRFRQSGLLRTYLLKAIDADNAPNVPAR